jgi:RHS repeat-associated protein
MGRRNTLLNAFGDVVQTRKVGNTPDPGVTYTPDLLGRIVSMTGPGVSRTFTWDRTAAGAAAPNGLGKLIDVKDAISGVSIHYDYGTQGLPTAKQWTIPAANGTSTETYSMAFAYDSQGRLSQLTYPLVPGESAPFAAKYAYDSFTGLPASITDTSNKTTPVWRATARNEWGTTTTQALAFQGKSMSMSESYYLPDNSLQTTQVAGTNSASVTYAYQFDGLVASSSTSVPGSSYTETFDYDNLGELTSWKPTSTAPAVTFAYDNYGRLTSRSWSSETVTYDAFALGAWTVKVNGGTPDSYVHDEFGRVTNTPAAKFTYDALDQVVQLTEVGSNQVDLLKHDAFGNRVLTVYGANGSAGSLVNLNDLFELKRSGSTTEGRCRLRVGGKTVGDVVRTNTAARTATFYLTNAVGSVVAELSSATGTVTARSRRDPFGNILTNPNSPSLPKDPTGTNPDGTSRLGFGDHERDPNWGVVDMLARNYSPRLGRFLSPDSVIMNLHDRRTLNPFAYVGNNPVSLVDPDGHGVDPNKPQSGENGLDRTGMEPLDPNKFPYSETHPLPGGGSVTMSHGPVMPAGAPPSPPPPSGVSVPGSASAPIASGPGGAPATGPGVSGGYNTGSHPSAPPMNTAVPSPMGVAQAPSSSAGVLNTVKSTLWALDHAIGSMLPGAEGTRAGWDAFSRGDYLAGIGNYAEAALEWGLAIATMGESAEANAVVGEVKGALEAVEAVEPVAGKITGFTEHGVDQAITREVSPGAIVDAVKDPLKVKDVVVDSLGRPSQRYIGREAEVVLNPETGKVVSVNPTSSRKAARLSGP